MYDLKNGAAFLQSCSMDISFSECFCCYFSHMNGASLAVKVLLMAQVAAVVWFLLLCNAKIKVVLSHQAWFS